MYSAELDLLFRRQKDFSLKKQYNSKPVIAVCGMMNAGKSYLLNMLTDHYNAEYFPTNDIRETAEIKQFESEAYIFLDTPGLDANQADDEVAINGVAKADVVLFVHQPQGELEKIELEFLEKLQESFGEYAEKHIVIIISKVDSETIDKIEKIQHKVLEQCNVHLDFSPRSFLISGTRFHKGIQQHKDALVKASHLNDLKRHIETLSIDVQAVREERTLHAKIELLFDISELEKKLETEEKLLESASVFDFSSFNQTIQKLELSILAKKAEYTKAKAEGK